MIRAISSFEECRDFAEGFSGDPRFSDPMLASGEMIRHNLLKAFEQPDRHCVLGVFREGEMIGFFIFLYLPGEKYLEMTVGLSRERDAYDEILRHVEENFAGYQVDFVFNPRNDLLKQALQAKGAEFEVEQQKMLLKKPVPEVDTTGVELFDKKYAQQYFAIHNQDMYWTGEKVAAAPEKFRTFLAVQDARVVGYLDITHCFEENEPYDLFVLEDFRRQGYGRKLLARAIEMNRPKDMTLLVEVDNEPAIRLYESMGFEKAENQNSQTVRWQV